MDFAETEIPEHVQLPIFIGIQRSHIDMVTGGENFDKKIYQTIL